MELLVILPAIALIPAAIASSKGHNFLGWWLFGIMLFIIALPVAILVDPVQRGRCPACLASIDERAAVCRHCGHDLGTNAHNGRRLIGLRCWKCGHQNPAHVGICSACHSSLHARRPDSTVDERYIYEDRGSRAVDDQWQRELETEREVASLMHRARRAEPETPSRAQEKAQNTVLGIEGAIEFTPDGLMRRRPNQPDQYFPVANIVSVTIEQATSDKSQWHIRIWLRDGGVQTVWIHSTERARAEKLIAAFEQAHPTEVEEPASDSDAQSPVVPSLPENPGTWAGDLEKLATLHDHGILTDEEFAAKKRQILGL